MIGIPLRSWSADSAESGGELTNKAHVLAQLVGEARKHTYNDRVGRLDVPESKFKGPADLFGRIALPSHRENLEGQTGLPGPAYYLAHARGVALEIGFAGRNHSDLRPVIPCLTRHAIKARHVKVRRPAFLLGDFHDGANVSGNSRHEAHIVNPVEKCFDQIEPPLPMECIGSRTVMGYGYGFRRRNQVDAPGHCGCDFCRRARLAVGCRIVSQRDPVHPATRFTHFFVLTLRALAVVALVGIDPGLLALEQKTRHPLVGVILDHEPIQDRVEMRVAENWIAPGDQPSHTMWSERNGGKQRLAFTSGRECHHPGGEGGHVSEEVVSGRLNGLPVFRLG